MRDFYVIYPGFVELVIFYGFSDHGIHHHEFHHPFGSEDFFGSLELLLHQTVANLSKGVISIILTRIYSNHQQLVGS